MIDERVRKPAVTIQKPAANSDTLKAFAQVAATPAGVKVFQYLMEYCGFKHSSLTMTADGQLLTDAIVHNEAKRAVWLETRKLIPPKQLNAIEREKETEPCPTKPKQ